MKLIIVPTYLDPLLKKGGLSYSALRDTDKLLTILSLSDVAFYLYLQKAAQDYLPKGFEDFNLSSKSLADQYYIGSANSDTVNTISDMIETSIRINHPINSVQDLLLLLDDSIVNDPTEDRNPMPYLDFDILHHDADAIYVRAKCVFGLRYSLLNTYEAFLAIYSKYLPLDAVAKLPLFSPFEAALRLDVKTASVQ